MRVSIGRPDRRAHLRSLSGTEPPRAHLTAMILGCFSEMPRLSLHLDQAARMFGLRLSTCVAVLRDLVCDGAICRTSDGQYVIGHFNGVAPESVPTHGQHNKAISKRGR